MSIETGTLKDYRKLRYRLARNAVDKRMPLRGMLELTYKCNHRCVYCYNAPSVGKKELSTRQIKSILDQLKEQGCFYMGFTGGEIFTRDDIFDILLHAKRCGMQLILKTNGTLIDEKKADMLAGLGINSIDLSILGTTEQTFDSITRVKGSFRRFERAVDILVKRKLPVRISTCVIKQNMNELMGMWHFAKNRNLRFRYDMMITPKSDGSLEPLNFRLSNHDIIDIKREVKENAGGSYRKTGSPNRPQERKNEISNIFRCSAGKHIFVITPYGQMKICIDIPRPLADVIKKGVAAAWEEVVAFVDKIKPSKDYKCLKCELKRYCIWCPARGLLEKGDLNVCVPFYKKMAVLSAKEAGDEIADKYQEDQI